MLPQRSPVETVEREGVSYMPATVKRSGETKKLRQIDRFPSLVCADDGRMYVAFTTNRGGTQDVYLRVFDGKKWSPDRPIAATEADEFDGTVIVDRQNRPWVTWTSNAAGPQYNIFAACVSESSAENAPTQITHCDPKDDTMHPRMAVDERGGYGSPTTSGKRFTMSARQRGLHAIPGAGSLVGRDSRQPGGHFGI